MCVCGGGGELRAKARLLVTAARHMSTWLRTAQERSGVAYAQANTTIKMNAPQVKFLMYKFVLIVYTSTRMTILIYQKALTLR